MTPPKSRVGRRSRLSDYNSSVRVMKAIVRRIHKEIDRKRPDYRYATVLTVSPTNRTARVYYAVNYDASNTDTSNVPDTSAAFTVRVGTTLPIIAGQRVRICGRSGDKYIDDVSDGQTASSWIGELRMNAAGFTPPGWLACNGGVYDPILYPGLFAAIGTTNGGTVNAPLLPNNAYIIRAC